MTKICARCNELKELDLFAKSTANKDGRKNYCKKCHANYTTQYVKDNPDKRSKDNPSRKFKRHGLDELAYSRLFNMYDGKCHSCQENDATSIDHDHTCCSGPYSCGKCVRGLLCHYCNTALGLMKDNPNKINKLLAYINC